MMYKNLLLCVTVVCGLVVSHTIDARSCAKTCSKKCSSTQTSPTFDCIPQTTEFLIVGLGTAGATLARYLSDPINGEFTHNVVVLEAGQNYNQDSAVLNPNIFSFGEIARSTKYSKTYSILPGANVNVGFDIFGYSEGRLWGGSSAHNGMQAVRGTPPLYDDWSADSGASYWLYNNLLPLMKFVEKYQPNGTVLDPLERGTDGPLTITQDDDSLVATNPFVVNFMSQLVNTPLPIIEDYNVPAGAIGICSFQQNNTAGQFTPGSIRTFSANSFLPTPADNPTDPIISEDGFGLNGRKLRIVSNATVSRVIFDGTTAVGVEYIFGENSDEVLTMFATKEVILCAGATEDVAILQRSGIGPQSVLDPLGITPIVYNDNVGAHLSNHYGTFCIMNTDLGNLAPVLGMFFSDGEPYYAGNGRRIIQSFFGPGPFLFPDLSVPVALVGTQVLNPAVYPTNTFAIINLITQSEGSIVIADTNPLTDAIVNCNIWSDTADYAPVIAGLKIVRDMAHDAGQTMLYPTESMFASDADLIVAINNLTFSSYHFACTCRMGLSAADAVVDGAFRVFGVQNLRIADCAIMPKISDGNTAIPAYYIGAILAKLLGNQTLPNIS